ncbi:MAG: Holliday junction resolvase RuvX [Candidatus Desulforudis sp.]|nr:Holliday junction resolvase RuvX [Desulforudis sp.]
MRFMGLDVGDRRIGVALSDEQGLIAFPLEVIDRTSRADDVRRIKELVERYGAQRVVVGVPKTLSGRLGRQAEKVLKFLEALHTALPVPVVPWDERLTTVQVEKLLVSADLRRRKRRKVVDKLAASLILNSYLSSLKSDETT